MLLKFRLRNMCFKKLIRQNINWHKFERVQKKYINVRIAARQVGHTTLGLL